MKFGELLVAAGVLQPEQLDRALKYQKKHGGRIGSILVELGYITEEELARYLEVQLGVTAVDLANLKIPPGVINMLPPRLAARYKVIPIRVEGHVLVLAMADPKNLFALDDIRFATGISQIKVMVASEHSILRALKHYYKIDVTKHGWKQIPENQEKTTVPDKDTERSSTTSRHSPNIGDSEVSDLVGIAMEELDLEEKKEESELHDIEKIGEEAPIIRIINKILKDAIDREASDIHIEAHLSNSRVRYRIDGILHDILTTPIVLHSALISRIKVMANLDISVRKVPQDGSISIMYKGRRIDFRVSTLPTLYGEKIVLRILDKAKGLIKIDDLGLDTQRLKKLKTLATEPQGMLLVTGPTGSGKTSTLYSILDFITSPSINIVTVEDPVEYGFEGINHVQVSEKTGMTFDAALRSILRQDPDAVMVGEIRDRKTAEIAIRAALTGHRVFSTLHTNSAVETITRLLDMNIDPFMIGSSLLLVIGQRLARRICPKCAVACDYDPENLRALGLTDDDISKGVFRKGKGCDDCFGSGYRGRIGLYEMLEITPEIRHLILRKATLADIEEQVNRTEFIDLRKDGINQVLAGRTTLEEIIRVTSKVT